MPAHPGLTHKPGLTNKSGLSNKPGLTNKSGLSNKPGLTNKEAIYLALSQVPPGKVITYGQLAQLAGLPGAARLAGSVLRELPEGTGLAWHRVINAQGRLSLPLDSPGYLEQTQRLTREGVEITQGKINLSRFGWLR